jgi:DNA-binding transcriptional ArsR family regulator
MELTEKLRIFGFSRKELRVLDALKNGLDTPLEVSRKTKVSRTAVYAILENLKERGLVSTHIRKGKKSWFLSPERDLDATIYDAKRALLDIPEGREELHGVSDATVIVHRGKEAVKKLMEDIWLHHKNERLYGFQGDVAGIGWNKLFSVEETNTFNRAVKKNGIIVEAILPDGWFERETRNLGVAWAKDFEGRTTRTHIVDEQYFKHGGQLYLFKDVIYLNAHNEELVIEIRNSDIQKMLMAFFRFMQDHSRSIDVNDLLRTLIKREEEKKLEDAGKKDVSTLRQSDVDLFE